MLVSAERAKDLRNKPVWVLGSGETTSHMLTSQWDDLTVGPASVSGPLAFARAGVSPSDVDVAELYDAFTYMLLLTLEDLGFCQKGRAARSSSRAHCVSAASSPRTPMVAGSRPATQASEVSSCWSRRHASCVVNADRARSPTPALPASAEPADGSVPVPQ